MVETSSFARLTQNVVTQKWDCFSMTSCGLLKEDLYKSTTTFYGLACKHLYFLSGDIKFVNQILIWTKAVIKTNSFVCLFQNFKIRH